MRRGGAALAGDGPVRHPYARAGTTRGERSTAVRDWLDEAGEGGLVRRLATDYARTSYFAVSALDAFGTREERPEGNDPPSAPLRWLLDGEPA